MKDEPVSIVVLSYNGRRLLQENLPSVVQAATGRNKGDEIILVDNGSTDGTEEFVKEKFPGVRLLRLETNHFVGAAYNAGVKSCSHRVVIRLNNDVRVTPDFIQPLLEYFACENIFSVSSLSLSPGEKRKAERPPYYLLYGGGQTAYHRARFLELGGFHPIYGQYYYEDRDLGYRAWKRGWCSLCVPASVVYHRGEETIRRDPRRSVNLLRFRNRIIFFLSCYDNFWTALGLIIRSIAHTLWCCRPYLLVALVWVYQNRDIILAKRMMDKPFWKFSDRQVARMVRRPVRLKKCKE
ncbi:MAG TPA: glycosyltransferase [bacterium]|nr:glycosyltransferase [bacterium]